MAELKLNAEERLVRGRVRLQKKCPFFGYLVLNLDIAKSKNIDTCGVNAEGNMVYNPEWIEEIAQDEVETALAHEVVHVALKHLSRKGKRDMELWNIAADLVANDILQSNGFKLLKGDGYCNPYDHMFEIGGNYITELDKKNVEMVYSELEKLAKKEEMSNHKGYDLHRHSGFGEDDKAGEKNGAVFDETKAQANERKWEKLLVEAYTHAKLRGEAPAGIERRIGELFEKKIDWKGLLYRYITNEIPFDYSWTKPSKKSVALGIYLPSLTKENIEMAVAIDTSGSISQKELDEFLSEVIGISQSFAQVKMTVISCDSSVNETYELENGNIESVRKLKMSGGGGTDFRPVFRWLEKNKPNTRLLIYFTDGYGTFPSQETTKTLWLVSKDGKKEDEIPFGLVVKLDGE